MKKNIRININGLIFNIDEDAYNILLNYLQRLRNHFGKGESTEEIISDIEARIAEIFQENSITSGNVVSIEMVEAAIKAMGEPGEIDGEEGHKEGETYEKSYNATYEKVKRKLYRDPDDKIIGGVAGGLAAYFAIQAIWVRLAFVILTISGMSLLVYIILWIAIPEARTTAQRLEMRGEAINLENIERSIRDEFDDISNRFKDMKDKHFSKKKDNLTIFEKIANAIVTILSGILKFIGAFLGVILVFVALLLILAFIPSFFSRGMIWLNNIGGFHLVSLNNVFSLLSNSPADINMLQAAIGLVVFIPLVSIVYLGVKILFGIRTKNSAIGVSLLTMWIVGLIMLVYSTTKIGRSYNRRAEVSSNTSLGIVSKDTIYINFVNTDSLFRKLPLINPIYGGFIVCNDDEHFYMTPDVRTISIDSNDEVGIEINAISRGRNYIAAQHNVDKISYNYNFNENNINLDNYCIWPNSIGYRAQRIKIEIGIPKGKVVVFNPMKKISYSEVDLNNCFKASKRHRFIYVDDERERVIISDGNNVIDIEE